MSSSSSSSSSSSKETQWLSNLISSESSWIDKSIELYNYVLDNQDNISYSEDGELVADDSIKSTLSSLLNSWNSAREEVTQSETEYQESLTE